MTRATTSAPQVATGPLRTSPVESDDANESLLELLVGERVAERVDRTVEVAEPVGDVVESLRDRAPQRCRVGRAREADDHRQHVPRDPADDERAEDDGDRAQRLARPAVATCQLLQPLPLRISRQTRAHVQLSTFTGVSTGLCSAHISNNSPRAGLKE